MALNNLPLESLLLACDDLPDGEMPPDLREIIIKALRSDFSGDELLQLVRLKGRHISKIANDEGIPV